MQHLTYTLKQLTNEFYQLYTTTPHYLIISQRYGINNHPIWLIGHLTHDYNKILTHLSTKANPSPTLPETWTQRFNTGSRPMPIKTLYPTTKELEHHWHINTNCLLDTIDQLTYDQLNYAHPTIIDHKTINHAITHLIAHTAYHTGQLTTYRAIHDIERQKPGNTQKPTDPRTWKEQDDKLTQQQTQQKEQNPQETTPQAPGNPKENILSPEALTTLLNQTIGQGEQKKPQETTTTPTYPCPNCTRTFTKRFALTNHIKSHK